MRGQGPIPLPGTPGCRAVFFGRGARRADARAADDSGVSCSVVIPCHNGAALTRACVESLLAQTGAALHEILLVDNGSTDATPALAALAPSVRVLHQPQNLGFAGGVNAGVRAATGEFVLILNNDTQAAPNLLAELSAALRSDARIGAVAPVSNHVKGEAWLPVGDAGRDAAQRAELAAALQHAGAPLQDVETLAGLCLLLRRTTLRAIGPFDEAFGHGNWEDDDYCLRLRRRGHRLVIARRAFLHHEGHATFRALGLDVRAEIARRGLQFVQKWRDDACGRAVISAARGDLAAAAGAAQDARREQPRWPDADWYLGREALQRGDDDAAIDHLTAFLRGCPAHVEARLGLGVALLRRGATARGQELLAQTVAAFPLRAGQQARLLEQLGALAADRGQHDAAERHFAHALELAPQSGALHNRLGLSRLARGRFAAAASAFEAAAEAGWAIAHTNVGICRHALGDLPAAAKSFARAVELLPDDPVARRNYEALLGATGTHGAHDRAAAISSSTIATSGVSGTQPSAADSRASDGTRRGGSTNPAGNTSANGTCTIGDALPARSRTSFASSTTGVSTALPTLTTPATFGAAVNSTSARATSPTCAKQRVCSPPP